MNDVTLGRSHPLTYTTVCFGGWQNHGTVGNWMVIDLFIFRKEPYWPSLSPLTVFRLGNDNSATFDNAHGFLLLERGGKTPWADGLIWQINRRTRFNHDRRALTKKIQRGLGSFSQYTFHAYYCILVTVAWSLQTFTTKINMLKATKDTVERLDPRVGRWQQVGGWTCDWALDMPFIPNWSR